MPRAHIALLLFAVIGTAGGDCYEAHTVATFLAHPILAPDQALLDVQAFVDAHLPPLPAAADAASWSARTDALRRRILSDVILRGDAADWSERTPGVEWQEIVDGGPGYHLRKLRFEAVPGLWIPAVLYLPDALSGLVPVVLNVHGHNDAGIALDYQQERCINEAKRGMIALEVEWLNTGQLVGDGFDHYRLNQLDLTGTSGLAPFYLLLRHALDLLLTVEHADPDRVAIVGLSGGGWQALLLAALDPRVTLANTVAGYEGERVRLQFPHDLGDAEQLPSDLATVADYTTLAAMVAPRPLLLTYNAHDDCCFEAGRALPSLLSAASAGYRLFPDRDALRWHINLDPGTHNFDRDNREQFYRLLGDRFFAGDPQFSSVEIPSEGEHKTARQLHVELPPENLDLHQLALRAVAALPNAPALPSGTQDAARWIDDQRAALATVTHLHRDEATVAASSSATLGELQATWRQLEIGEAWNVPTVEISPRAPTRTILLVADGGRAGAARDVARLVASNARVLAVDPFGIGESEIAPLGSLFGLALATVGERPLGLLAGELAAIARFATRAFHDGPITVVALGPRASFFSLVAAAVEPDAIGALELHGALGSLKEVIERNGSSFDTPELFCFGLLERFDVRQILALVAPRRVTLVDPSPRATSELNDLAPWWSTAGAAPRARE